MKEMSNVAYPTLSDALTISWKTVKCLLKFVRVEDQTEIVNRKFCITEAMIVI